MNVRAEPVLFVRRDGDMVPYVATTSDLRVYCVTDPATPRLTTDNQLSVADVEVALRKEARLNTHHHD